jgi:polysaccharide export outer membrane protein
LVLWTSASAQVLRPGDQLDISVWQDPKLDRKVIVSPTGMISMPLVGHVRASGITTQGLEKIIGSRLQKNYTGKLDITVTFAGGKELEDAEKPRVFITGEVLRPGPYPLLTKTNLMQAISLAGGLGPFAAERRIQVRRKVNGHETIFVFNYKAFESGADMMENIDVRSGDVIIVPERGFFE